MRSPRLSLTRRQLVLGVKLCELAILRLDQELVGLEQELTDADEAFMAVRDGLSHRDRFFSPVGRRKLWARGDVLRARRETRELQDLRARLVAALEKEIT